MKKISNLLMFIGVILLIGTAGASDVGNIEFLQIVKQILVASLFIVSSILLSRLSFALKYKKKYASFKKIAYLGSVKWRPTKKHPHIMWVLLYSYNIYLQFIKRLCKFIWKCIFFGYNRVYIFKISKFYKPYSS